MGEAHPLASVLDVNGFAVQDENRFIAIDGHSLVYLDHGEVDTLKDIAGPLPGLFPVIQPLPGGTAEA